MGAEGLGARKEAGWLQPVAELTSVTARRAGVGVSPHEEKLCKMRDFKPCRKNHQTKTLLHISTDLIHNELNWRSNTRSHKIWGVPLFLSFFLSIRIFGDIVLVRCSCAIQGGGSGWKERRRGPGGASGKRATSHGDRARTASVVCGGLRVTWRINYSQFKCCHVDRKTSTCREGKPMREY